MPPAFSAFAIKTGRSKTGRKIWRSREGAKSIPSGLHRKWRRFFVPGEEVWPLAGPPSGLFSLVAGPVANRRRTRRSQASCRETPTNIAVGLDGVLVLG